MNILQRNLGYRSIPSFVEYLLDKYRGVALEHRCVVRSRILLATSLLQLNTLDKSATVVKYFLFQVVNAEIQYFFMTTTPKEHSSNTLRAVDTSEVVFNSNMFWSSFRFLIAVSPFQSIIADS